MTDIQQKETAKNKSDKVKSRNRLTILFIILLVVVIGFVGYNIYRYPAMFRKLNDESLNETQTNELKENIAAKTDKKILVAYFSYSGTTQQIANALSEQTGADLFEITTQEEYDNVYVQSNSEIRKNARPSLTGSVENMEQYDIVFIGFPIWWHATPAPVSTFLESYDLTGKLIVPFCTSGESDISEAMPTFLNSCSGLAVYGSRRMTGTGEISAWLTELDITGNNADQNEKTAY